MIFRKQDYTPVESDPQIEAKINEVKEFALKIAPDNWKEKINDIAQKMTVIVCENGSKHKVMHNGKLKDMNLSSAAGAHKFFTDVNDVDFSCNQGVAFRKNVSNHVIAHEVLHAFSSESGRVDGAGFVKTGASYTEEDGNGQVKVRRGSDINEAITDALASRFRGKFGPNTEGASYVSQVIVADLLIGENVENNNFIHDVYFGKSENFIRDFNKTVKTADINFEDYLSGFKVIGTEDESKKSDKLLRGAIEYNLKKAQTVEEIESVFAFQTKVIDFYRNGELSTGFLEDEDVARLDKLKVFAGKMRNTCKSAFMEKDEKALSVVDVLRGKRTEDFSHKLQSAGKRGEFNKLTSSSKGHGM